MPPTNTPPRTGQPATSTVTIDELVTDPGNARLHDERNRAAIANSIERFGANRSLVIDKDGRVLAGNGTLEAARQAGVKDVTIIESDGKSLIAVRRTDLTPEEARGYSIADNRAGDLADWDYARLLEQLGTQQASGIDLTQLGFSAEDHKILMRRIARGPSAGVPLIKDFIVPPFTVLDTRQGYWISRKQAWLDLGIESELGRDQGLAYHLNKDVQYSKNMLKNVNKGVDGTSTFDPVLCEIAYRWFSPARARVLDPFAGGSVRGIIAAALGREYVGIDLSKRQIEANRDQWNRIGPGLKVETVSSGPRYDPEKDVTNPDALTPIEEMGDCWAKRDDLLCIEGVRGGKVRTCLRLASAGGDRPLVTASSRSSPQANIVAHIARHLGVTAHLHTPTGELSPELEAAAAAGATVHQHKIGRNNVIISRARKHSEEIEATEIPFGMECQEAVDETSAQVDEIPKGVSRIVIPVGSGMSLAGLLDGLAKQGIDLPVLGVTVGADPTKRLDKYAPSDWRMRVVLIPSGSDYHAAAPTGWRGIHLDPHYEAKCVPYLDPGDLLWIVGIRQTEAADQISKQPEGIVTSATPPSPEWIVGDSAHVTLPGPKYDLIFTCPPYGDLEIYSDDPDDLSVLGRDTFLSTYRAIIRRSVEHLNDDRFVFIVVGNYRNRKTGQLYDLVGDTIAAGEAAGLTFWNDLMLITSVASGAIRARRVFINRKLVRGHQTVVVMVKGDAHKASAICGDPV